MLMAQVCSKALHYIIAFVFLCTFFFLTKVTNTKLYYITTFIWLMTQNCYVQFVFRDLAFYF